MSRRRNKYRDRLLPSPAERAFAALPTVRPAERPARRGRVRFAAAGLLTIAAALAALSLL